MATQSPIFVKTEAFMLWLFQHTPKFPRVERLRLAKRLDDSIAEFHRCLLYAVKTGDKRYLRDADAELDLLRTYLKLTTELGYTTPDQYAYAAAQTAELGKLLGGWLGKA